MNTRRGKAKFKNFRILLDSRCSYRSVMRSIMKNFEIKEGSVVEYHIQADNITTNLKVKIYFTLPEFSTTKTVTWNCHVYDTANGRYDIIRGRYL